MNITNGTTMKLVDKANRKLGTVTVERLDDNLVLGCFEREPAFAEHEKLFHDFEEAVGAQALPTADDLCAKIARLGLQILDSDNGAPLRTDDIQIWSDGGISFRVSALINMPTE